MNAEYQRLEAEASEVQNQINVSLGASKPATYGRFKTSRGVNVQ